MDLDFLIGAIPANPNPLPSGIGVTEDDVAGILKGIRAFAETGAAKTSTPFDDMALRFGGESLFGPKAASVIHEKLKAIGWGR